MASEIREVAPVLAAQREQIRQHALQFSWHEAVDRYVRVLEAAGW